MKQQKLKPAFRRDSRPWIPGRDQGTVTPAKAYEAMIKDYGSEAEAARKRMLVRKGLTKKDQSAAAARDQMIQRTERHGR